MPKPSHNLLAVTLLAQSGNYLINSNALQLAMNDFGWGPADILACIALLNDSHCYKTEKHYVHSGCMVDFYRAPNLKDGEDIYTHFYVKNGCLIINSFHAM